MSGEMNRRGFIKGAGFLAAAACGGAANGGTSNVSRTAAALCVKTGATPRTLDATSLVKSLKNQGAFLG